MILSHEVWKVINNGARTFNDICKHFPDRERGVVMRSIRNLEDRGYVTGIAEPMLIAGVMSPVMTWKAFRMPRDLRKEQESERVHSRKGESARRYKYTFRPLKRDIFEHQKLAEITRGL